MVFLAGAYVVIYKNVLLAVVCVVVSMFVCCRLG